jgi:hypothetical protein
MSDENYAGYFEEFPVLKKINKSLFQKKCFEKKTRYKKPKDLESNFELTEYNESQ